MTPITFWDWFFAALGFFSLVACILWGLWVILSFVRGIGRFAHDEAAGFVQFEYERRERLERRRGNG